MSLLLRATEVYRMAARFFDSGAGTNAISQEIFCWSRIIYSCGVKIKGNTGALFAPLFEFAANGLSSTNRVILKISEICSFLDVLELKSIENKIFGVSAPLFHLEHTTKANPRDTFQQFAQVLTQMPEPIRKVTPGTRLTIGVCLTVAPGSQ